MRAAEERLEQFLIDKDVGPVSAEKGQRRFEIELEEFLATTSSVIAVEVATGIGKTTIATARLGKSTVYFVPTHRLGDAVKLKHLPGARVFRGRDQPVPGQPDQTMCMNLAQVDQALAAGLSVESTCCRRKIMGGKEQRCAFYETCAYQAQKRNPPKVWITAHEMLFYDQEAFGYPKRIIIDEEFLQAGLERPKSGVDVDDIIDEACPQYLEAARDRLAQVLRRAGDGGVAREAFKGVLTIEQCTAAIAAEWRNIHRNERTTLYPGMPTAERRAAKEKLAIIKHDRKIVNLFTAVRELLKQPAGTISGWLRIETRGKQRIVKLYGIKKIVARFANAPTFIMSATLPDWEILRRFYPKVKIACRIEVTTPHASIRQVWDAPVTQRKLESDRNKKALRDYIITRWQECGQQPTVVIAQKKYADWLRASSLPPSIKVEHYNAIRGLDEYKIVRLLICIGRTLPGPAEVESQAGALTGIEPHKAKGEGAWGGAWYEKDLREIAPGVEIAVDRHPDKMAEAVRKTICEDEIMQAVGRARAVRRKINEPVDIDILANVKLPLRLTRDEVREWEPVNALPVMLYEEGILPLSATDLARARPGAWTLRAAERAVCAARKTPPKPSLNYINEGNGGDIRKLRYQPTGTKQKWREAWFLPSMLPNPREWLENNIGPMAHVEVLS